MQYMHEPSSRTTRNIFKSAGIIALGAAAGAAIAAGLYFGGVFDRGDRDTGDGATLSDQYAQTPSISPTQTADESGIQYTPTPRAAEINIGSTVEVDVLETCLSSRYDPDLESEILDCLLDGYVGKVINGPVEADGYTWWELEGKGWSAEDWLRLRPSEIPSEDTLEPADLYLEYIFGDIPLLLGGSEKAQGSMSDQNIYDYGDWGFVLYDNGFSGAMRVENILEDFGGGFSEVYYAVYKIEKKQREILNFYDEVMEREGWSFVYRVYEEFGETEGSAWRKGPRVAIILVGIDFPEYVYPTSIAIVVAE